MEFPTENWTRQGENYRIGNMNKQEIYDKMDPSQY